LSEKVPFHAVNVHVKTKQKENRDTDVLLILVYISTMNHIFRPEITYTAVLKYIYSKSFIE